MRLWNVTFTGRKAGALGIFCQLEPVTVDAPTLPEAVEAARLRLPETHEHLHSPIVSGPLDSED